MAPEYKKLALPDIYRHLYKKKKIIIIISLGVSIVTAIITLFIHNEYKAEANLLPSQSHNIGLGLLSNSNIGSLAGTLLQKGTTQIDKFYVLLNSYTTQKRVIEKFDLEKVYKTSKSDYPLLYAMNDLKKNTSFEGHDEGNFVIDVWDRDPERAKAMADYYVKLLNQFNTQISVKEAKDYRIFIQNRYDKAKHALDSLVTKKTEFESKYGVYNLPAQMENYMDLMGDLASRKIEVQIKLDILKKSLNQNSTVYQKNLNELNAINQKLLDFHTKSDTSMLMISLDRLPDIGQKYFYIQFGLTVQQKIMEFILPLFEQAKMEEAKAIPVVTVVDAPVVPRKKAWPKRSIIVILAFLSAFIVTNIFLLGELAYHNNKDYFDYIRNK